MEYRCARTKDCRFVLPKADISVTVCRAWHTPASDVALPFADPYIDPLNKPQQPLTDIGMQSPLRPTHTHHPDPSL